MDLWLIKKGPLAFSNNRLKKIFKADMTGPPQNTFVEPSWHLTIGPIILIILLAISIRYDPLMRLFLKELPGTMT